MKPLEVCTFVFILHQNSQKLLKSFIKHRRRPIHPGMMNSLGFRVLHGVWDTALSPSLGAETKHSPWNAECSLDMVLSPAGLKPHMVSGQRLDLISEVISNLSNSMFLCCNVSGTNTGIFDQKLFLRRDLMYRNDTGKVFVSINTAFSVDTQDSGF